MFNLMSASTTMVSAAAGRVTGSQTSFGTTKLRPKCHMIGVDGSIFHGYFKSFLRHQLLWRFNKDLRETLEGKLSYRSLVGGNFSVPRVLHIRAQLLEHEKGRFDPKAVAQLMRDIFFDLPLRRMVDEYSSEHLPPLFMTSAYFYIRALSTPTSRAAYRAVYTAFPDITINPLLKWFNCHDDLSIATPVKERNRPVANTDFTFDEVPCVVGIDGSVEGIVHGPKKGVSVEEMLRKQNFDGGICFCNSIDDLHVALRASISWERIVFVDPPDAVEQALALFNSVIYSFPFSSVERKKVMRIFQLLRADRPTQMLILRALERGIHKSRPIEILKAELFEGRHGIWPERGQNFVYSSMPAPPWGKNARKLGRIYFDPHQMYWGLRERHTELGSFFDVANKHDISPADLFMLMRMRIKSTNEGTQKNLRDFFSMLRSTDPVSTYGDAVGELKHLDGFLMAVNFGAQRARQSRLLPNPQETYHLLQTFFTIRDFFRGEDIERQREMMRQSMNLAFFADPYHPGFQEDEVNPSRNIDDYIKQFVKFLGLKDVEVLERMTEYEFVKQVGKALDIDYFYADELSLVGEKEVSRSVLLGRAIARRAQRLDTVVPESIELSEEHENTSDEEWRLWSRQGHGVVVLEARLDRGAEPTPVLAVPPANTPFQKVQRRWDESRVREAYHSSPQAQRVVRRGRRLAKRVFYELASLYFTR